MDHVKAQLTNILFAVAAVAILGYVAAKVALRPRVPLPVVCPSVPYTLSPEVTAYISEKLKDRDAAAANLDALKMRVEKIDDLLATVKAYGAGPLELAQKIEAFEKRFALRKKEALAWRTSASKGERLRIRHTMVYQCKAKPTATTKAGVN